MDWLARREYSRHEIEQKLCRRFPDATAAIGPVLDQLEHEGLLSDARYLESVIHSHVRRGYGPLRIRAALGSKGVEHDMGTAGPVDWLAQAREARRRKFGDVLPVDAAERARQMQFLLRRGFSSAICRQACLPPRGE
ncbi:MAG: regulatory protein RecX [Pseudomonadota bacterium]